MPLFAKKSAEGSATEVQEIRMTDTFERGRAVEVLSKVVQESRRRAKAIIQEELPEYIEHLASLLERAEVDETSPLWKGHLESEHFAKENIRLIAPGDHSGTVNDASYKSLPPCTCSDSPDVPLAGATDFAETQGAKSEDSEVDLEKGTALPLGRCWQHTLSSNETCDQLMKLLQVEGERALSMALMLRRWARLEVPTVEDGGNFGVGVQKQCLNNIDTFLNDANSVRRFGQEKYYPSRTNMIRAWCQYPNVHDHAAAVATIDRNGFSGARIDLEDLLTGAAYILSHMRKNWAKVHDPKSKGDKEEANVLY